MVMMVSAERGKKVAEGKQCEPEPESKIGTTRELRGTAARSGTRSRQLASQSDMVWTIMGTLISRASGQSNIACILTGGLDGLMLRVYSECVEANDGSGSS